MAWRSWPLRGKWKAPGRRMLRIALRFGGALEQFWEVHGYWSEGRTFLDRALVAREGIEAFVQAKALYAAANLAFKQSNYERAEALSKESLALYRELEDKPGIAFSPWVLGNIAWVRSNTAEARSLLEEDLALFKEVGFKENAAYSLFSLALLANSQGEYARACTLYEE